MHFIRAIILTLALAAAAWGQGAVRYNATTNALVEPTASQFRNANGLQIGVNVQAYDSDLTTWAAISPSANVQTLLSSANYAAFRTALGLVIGTNVQAWDADLDTWATKTAPSGAVLGSSDTQTVTNKTISGASNTLTVRAASDITGTLLQANGGTGATSMPYVEALRNSGGSQVIADGNTDILICPTVTVDTHGCYASNAFTAPRAGMLLVSIGTYGPAGVSVYHQVWVNGAMKQGATRFIAVGTATIVAENFMVPVQSGDVVTARLQNASGGSIDVYDFLTGVRYYLLP